MIDKERIIQFLKEIIDDFKNGSLVFTECDARYVEMAIALLKENSMAITVGHVIDNPTFSFDGWFEITTTDDDGTVHTLYDSYDDMDKDVPVELIIEPITYMVVNKEKGRLRLEVR